MGAGPTRELTDFLRLIGDPTRLKILRLLMERELCVCQIVELTGMGQPAVSQHLAKLRMARLVRERKDAQWVYYVADREAVSRGIAAVQDFFQGALAEISELAEPGRRLATLPGCEEIRLSR